MTRLLAAPLALLLAAASPAGDRFMGTWRLDKVKSRIAVDPGVKSKEIVFAPAPGGGVITETLEMKSGAGGRQVTRLRFVYGRFTPQSRPGIDSFAVNKEGADRIYWTARLKGATVARLRVDLSADGRELTFRYLYSAADRTGKVTADRYVYDRR